MKRILSLALVVMLVLSLISCGGAEGLSTEPAQPGVLVSSEPAAPAQSSALPTPEPAVPEDKATYKETSPESVVQTEKWGAVPANQVIVVFYDEVDKATARQRIEQSGAVIVGELDFINLYQVETTDQTEAQLTATLEAFAALEGVELVFPNVEVYGKNVEGIACTPLKDPVFEDPNNAAHYNTIGMENAWRIIKGSGVKLNKVSVGVLDDSIYTGSDEFAGKAKVTGDKTEAPEKNDSGQIIYGGLSHGTMVTHVIGADSENSGMVGVAGVLEDNLNIDVKNLFDGKKGLTLSTPDADDITQAVTTEDGVQYTYTVKALVYLQEQVKNGAKVINCSYGPKEPDDDHEFISKAYEKFFKKIQETNPDVVFVAAAGNEGKADKSKGALNGKNYFPAGLKLPNIITVGAIENDGKRASFSNFATDDAEVTLSAPGVEMLLGVDVDGKPIKASGTSFAAPQVTAAIALIQSINPELSASAIKNILVESAMGSVTVNDKTTPIPEGMGAGVLRVDVAVLKTINDMRAAKGEAPYTFNDLFNNTFVSLRAAGGPLNYVVTASIPSAQGGGTDVFLDVSGGQHFIKGSSTQRVSAGGEVTWDITLDKEEVFVRVTRLDNGGCAYMMLKPEAGPIQLQEMAGTFTGTAVLQDVMDDVEADESLPVTIQFGEEGTGTANVFGFDGEAQSTGNKVAFSVKMEQDGFSVYANFDGTVSRSGSQLVISGNIRMTMMGIRFATYSLTAMK